MIIQDKNLLNKKSIKVSYEEGLLISDKLWDELKKHPNGLGLAAPQIDIFKQVFIINCPERAMVCINPTLLPPSRESFSEDYILSNEGCLSFPDEEIVIFRRKRIEVFIQSGPKQLEQIHLCLNGLEAIVFQHEFDHLNGITILDHGNTIESRCVC